MRKRAIIITTLVLLLVPGCNEPETLVTNVVHSDGSVTRRVEIRNSEDVFDAEFYRVPIDSSWSIIRTMEVSDRGDTVWVMTAEKLFANISSINSDYSSADGINSELERSVNFTKSFRWFNTHFAFSERVEKIITDGYPLGEYLNSEELSFFSLPGSVSDELMSGADSLFYRSLSERTDSLVNIWFSQSLISSWMENCSRLLIDEGADSTVITAFMSKKTGLLESYAFLSMDFDSIIELRFEREVTDGWGNLFDKAMAELENKVDLFLEAKVYTVQTTMPGKLTGGNGYLTPAGDVAWPVKPELFLFDDYEMIANSQQPNMWAWYLSASFLLIVSAGFVFRWLKRK